MSRSHPILIGMVAGFAAAAVVAVLYLHFTPVYSISIPPTDLSSGLPLQYGALPALSNPDYYAKVKDKLSGDKSSFIDANLTEMRLSVYIDGEIKLVVPIVAKGKVGSWWETPAGVYQIQSKEKSHLSSIGDVYMPYSMDFQGNFFIHGWPYYEDGTPVSSTYSGGCIRLATDDAEKVYALVQVGMPVVVYNRMQEPDAFDYQLKAPYISASEYLVADAQNGTVLLSRNASTTAPIASITKLVSALVATEYINLDKKITVPANAIVYTSVPRLKANQSIRVYDLLFLLLEESSNEAADTIASSLGTDAFVSYMNKKAQSIGLSHTSFVDPSGAKEGNVSTPEDLFALLRYIYDNRRFVFGITTGSVTDSAYGTPAYKNLSNFNRVPDTSDTLLGGKVGETIAAKETYAGIFSVNIGGETRSIAVIVLGSSDEYQDVRALLSFVERSYAPGETEAAQQ